jgi:hypothetical protein
LSNHTKTSPVINEILKFRTVENVLGNYFCGYYVILFQYFTDLNGEDTLGPYSNNQDVKNYSKNDANYLRENVVKLYLNTLQNNLEDTFVEKFKDFRNG